MNYVENPLSIFVQDYELAYSLESESGVVQGCPGGQIIFGGSIIPLCRLLQMSLDGSTTARWIWDGSTIAGRASDIVHGFVQQLSERLNNTNTKHPQITNCKK